MPSPRRLHFIAVGSVLPLKAPARASQPNRRRTELRSEQNLVWERLPSGTTAHNQVRQDRLLGHFKAGGRLPLSFACIVYTTRYTPCYPPSKGTSGHSKKHTHSTTGPGFWLQRMCTGVPVSVPTDLDLSSRVCLVFARLSCLGSSQLGLGQPVFIYHITSKHSAGSTTYCLPCLVFAYLQGQTSNHLFDCGCTVPYRLLSSLRPSSRTPAPTAPSTDRLSTSPQPTFPAAVQ
ncbi:hypothetical protein B0T22DRAFT_31923 [Podospora appendiculata]|uniref:Uncharacterized protein n=1 Tax=Podospora appendiculata TaxID=314037 RepID=A0AAE0XGT0_9PEZI|nr:hypothetical protein B0T22DRAFT_31923 [Podospora appendiculata]